MKVSSYYDGDIMWTWLEDTYSWMDGESSHHIILASKGETIATIIDSWKDAVAKYKYIRDCSSQFEEEIGDISFNEF